MGKKEAVTYTCDRCHIEMGKPHRKISIETDITELWNPKTWGTVSIGKKDLCKPCFDKFVQWLHD